MSIDAIGPGAGNAGAMRAQFQQMRDNFKQLGDSLTAGNLADAQKAFATLQQNMAQGPQGKGGDGKNPFQADLQAVGDALQSGNLADAQKAYAKFQQDVQSRKGAHHGHHHHKPADNDGDQDASSGASTNTIDVKV